MAPWVHTYLSPQTERRMCCASREPAQNFEQYIDTAAGSGKYIPITLDEHWNSPHMMSVRSRMMSGETLPECEVCNDKLLNTDVYRTYFWQLFKHKYPDIWETTDTAGRTTMQPVSWDYRFSNLCNFKCRTCGDMLSSSWESEQRQHNMIDWSNSKNSWMRPEVRKTISAFQDSEIEAEFAAAVEQHRVEEVYWVGGEPLMYEQHWRYMIDTIQIYPEWIIEVLTYIAIFSVGCVIGRYVQVSTAQAQLANTLEQALSMIAGLSILVKQLRSNVTDVKYELTLRSLCPECSKLHALDNLHKHTESTSLLK